MNKIKNALLAVLGISLVAFTLSVTGAGRAVAQSTFTLVKVINSTSEPVPTTVTNSPTVKLASLSAVTVNNSEGNPVPVRSMNDGITPFQQSVIGSFPAGSLSGSGIIAVPTGKRLVIEYVSAHAPLPSGQNLSQVTISTKIKDTTVQHSLVRNDHGPHLSTSSNLFVVGQSLRLYADEDTPIIFSLVRSSSLNSSGFSVTISGYLIDIP